MAPSNSACCEELYERCKDLANGSPENLNKVFSQSEVIELCVEKPLDHITNAHTLLPIVTELCQTLLFIPLKSKSGSGSSWSLRRKDIAKQIRGLDRDELMVYQVIEESYESGVWIKNIRKKSGINDAKSMDKLIAKLQRLSLIKSVKNVKAPAQRTYMLHHLAPSDEVTGGSFYDAGDLDESLVEELSNLIVFHVKQMSWVEGKKKRVKREHSPILVRDDVEPTTTGATGARGRKKRKLDGGAVAQANDIEDSAPPRKKRSNKHTHDPETDIGPAQVSHPAGHEYPTPVSIHSFVTNSAIIRAVKASSLTVDEIQNILNVLVWDEKLEEVNGGYRTVRGVTHKQPGQEEDHQADEDEWKRGNGLTEAPCGRCPVFDLCGPGSLINAATCVYFDRWLNREVAAV